MSIDSESVINKGEFDMIESIAICTICTGIIIEAVQCDQCQNSFCKECIESWNQSSNVCPFRCQNYKVIPSRLLRNLLSKLKFTCKYNCGGEVSYDDYKEHITKTCPELNPEKKYEKLLKSYNLLKTDLEQSKTNNNQLQKQYDALLNSNNQLKSKIYQLTNQLNELKIQKSTMSSDKNNTKHEHPLTFCRTDRTLWFCNKCNKTFDSLLTKSYYCVYCDYDLCFECYTKDLYGL